MRFNSAFKGLIVARVV